MGLSAFTARECDYFRAACNFTAQERAVFDLRVRGCSVVEIAMALHGAYRCPSFGTRGAAWWRSPWRCTSPPPPWTGASGP